MCGLIGYSGEFSEELLNQGLSEISHRGPDDRGTYFDREKRIGLGHCRLSILDVSHLGHQPMISRDKSVVLVFNGEIYNYKELRNELESKGYEFKSNSDTEVLLNLYISEGKGMLKMLNGIFTFAFFDLKTDAIFIARDGFGVKPLYISENKDGFCFASEIKAIIKLLSDQNKIDYQSINNYLSFMWCPGSGTPIHNIKKVLPGEAIVVERGKIKKRWKWYELPIFKEKKLFHNKKNSIEGTRYYLKQAVKRQLVSDVPVGAFLSGGLDSSSIVAMAIKNNPDISCFSIKTSGGVEKGMTDDLPYAKEVAKFLGVELNIIPISSNKMCDDFVRMIRELDEPLSDPAVFNLKYICQLARDQGIKVLLSGAGGDDIFTGYRRHKAIAYDKYWKLFPDTIKNGIERTAISLDQRNPYFRKLTKFMNGVSLNEDKRLANFFIWSRQKDLINIFNKDLRHIFEKFDALDPMLNFLAPLKKSSIKPLEKMLALEQRFFLTDHNLNYTDKMSMAVGVEVRVPFLDNDLVEFAHQIPLKYKQKNGHGKWILKKSMEPYLPKNIIYRPKSGFGAPLRHWIKNELKELTEDMLSVASIKKRGIFDEKQVQKMIRLNYEGKIDAAYTLFSILCIEVWCRSFLDRE